VQLLLSGCGNHSVSRAVAAQRRGLSERMKRIGFPAVIASMLALSACAYGGGGTGVFLADCSRQAIEQTKDIDWEKANTVSLRIRQGDFSPGYLGLVQGKAYVLRVENGDDEEHVFRAIDFFRSVAVAQINVIGGRSFETPCVDALKIGRAHV